MKDGLGSGGPRRGRPRARASSGAIDENRDLTPPELHAPARKRIAVVGEFNSGKTTLVNMLVGAPVLAASVIVHTRYPTVVAFAARPALSARTADRRRLPVSWDAVETAAPESIRALHLGVPLQRLKAVTVIDTPGLGFAGGESDRRSLEACRKADTVIWCTPAMQAWKASEERMWRALPERVRARGILAVTFADQIPSLADADRLLARLRSEAGRCFRTVVTANECADLVLPQQVSSCNGRRPPPATPAPRRN